MNDRGYFVQGDLKEAMRQEAREEQQANAEAAYYDGIQEIDNVDDLQEERADLAEDIHNTNREISQLERQIQQLEEEREKKKRRKHHVERRMRDVDPEIIIEVTAHNAPRYGGWRLGITVEKAPPMPDHDGDEDPMLANHPVSETVSEAVSEFTDGIDAEEYEAGETIVTLTFDDAEDDDPDVERCE